VGRLQIPNHPWWSKYAEAFSILFYLCSICLGVAGRKGSRKRAASQADAAEQPAAGARLNIKSDIVATY
jgi:hypothetical protein